MSPTEPGADQKFLASRAAQMFSLITCFTTPLGFVIWYNVGSEMLWPWSMCFAFSLIGLAATYKFQQMPIKLSAAIILGTTLSVFFASTANIEIGSTQNHLPADIFGAFKIISIVMVVIAPIPSGLGYFIISLCLFIPPLQTLLFTPEVLTYSKYSEPWYTMCFAIASIFLLTYRLTSQKTNLSLIKSQANEQKLREFADIAVALRDLTNSPLQSLEVLGHLLESQQITHAQAAQILNKTTYRLRELMQILNEHQKKIPEYKPVQSLDSIDVIRKTFSASQVPALKDLG